jgi:N-acetylglucosaminyldiphosphoundecaprenol N-acetyl-beta-D-mannosaminyltransferase
MAVEVTPGPAGHPIWALGLPLAPLTPAQVLQLLDSLMQARTPSYFITANLNYAMLSSRNEDLQEINRQATFLLADGMPLVWVARWRGTPLPERVAGSDLIFELARLAAEHGRRVFLLGAGRGVGRQAAESLIARYPGLQIVGIESPDMQNLSDSEHAELISRIREAQPDLLLVAFGQPKGERWIHANYQALGVPVSVQVGASLDFAAGLVRRAPVWMQRLGLEWVFRLALEPRRLTRRYLENGLFFLGQLFAREPHRHAERRGG